MAMMKFEIIELLPLEVVRHILSYLDINEIISLANELEHPRSMPNLTSLITKYIRNCNICFTNRVNQYTFLGMYLLTPSYIPKKKLDLVISPEMLYLLMELEKRFNCQWDNEITISFYIWEIADLIQFREIITKMQSINPSANFTYNVELEFDPGVLATFDFNIMLQKFIDMDFNHKVTSMQITNYVNFCDVDFCILPNLKRLWLMNANLSTIDDNYLKDSKVTDLHISPNPFGEVNSMAILIRFGISLSIQTLRLSHVKIDKNSLQYEVPQHLQTLSLTSIKDSTHGEFVCKLMEASTSNKSLKNFSIRNLYCMNQKYNAQLYIMIRNYAANLQHISVVEHLFENANDERLRLYYCINIQSLELGRVISTTDFKSIFRSLTFMSLKNCQIKSLDSMIFPDTLMELLLSHNPIKWRKRVKFPPKLTKLELRGTKLKSLDFLVLPESLITLSLEVNLLTSLSNFRFPSNLKSLGVGSNRIKDVSNHYLPKTLAILHLTENQISGPIDFEVNADNEELNLFALYMNYNHIKSVRGFKFCKSLKVLNLDDNDLGEVSDLTFSGLTELSLCGCNIGKFRNVNLDNSLKVLNLGNNNIKTIPHLPKSLILVNFQFNKLTAVPNDKFRDFECLTKLNLSNNSIRSAQLILHPSLQSLDLSNNKIVAFKLHYEKHKLEDDTTNLMSVNLSGNRLKDIKPKDLGLEAPIQHRNLYELDVSANKIEPHQIDVNKYPANIWAIFVGNSGRQDSFGYVIAPNMFHNALCTGKRIDC